MIRSRRLRRCPQIGDSGGRRAWAGRYAEESALTKATLLNGSYSSLQGDYLITGDRERAEAALDELCAWIDSCVRAVRRTDSSPA